MVQLQAIWNSTYTYLKEMNPDNKNIFRTALLNNKTFGKDLVEFPTSRFIILCLVLALILNRTVLFASARRGATISFVARLALLLPSITFLSLCILSLSVLKNSSCSICRKIPLNITQLLKGKDENEGVLAWTVFMALSLSTFSETFLCSMQSRIPKFGNGMTFLELSLVANQIYKQKIMSESSISFLSITCMSYLLTNILSLFRLSHYTLVTSTLTGLYMLYSITYSIIFKGVFPSSGVVVLCYIPYICIIFTTLFVTIIYMVAAYLIGDLSNMRMSFQPINIYSDESFYAVLSRIGDFVLTPVTNAGYTSEAFDLTLSSGTWIESIPSGIDSGYSVEIKKVHTDSVQPISIGPHLIVQKFVFLFRLLKKTSIFILYLLKGKWRISRDETQTVNENLLTTPSVLSNASDNKQAYTTSFLLGPIVEEDEAEENLSDYDPDDAADLYDDYENDDEDDDAKENGVGIYKSEYEIETDGRTIFEEITEKVDSNGDAEIDIAIETQEPVTDLSQLRNSLEFKAESLESLNDLFGSDSTFLNNLLTPESKDAKELSLVLRSHLNSPFVVTRSKYSKKTLDEATMLENLIWSRRNPVTTKPNHEEEGILCVVCQCNNRNIILWPCRCFAICDDCRSTLAVKQFKGCVSCRKEVNGFSKIFIP